MPGAGAAGGLGAGFLFFTNARLEPGIKIVLEAVDFERIVKTADLVITGEGRTDFQTVFGKAPVGVARIASKYNVPTICLSGSLGNGYEEVFSHGINGTMSIIPGPMSLAEGMENAAALLKDAAANMCRILSIGARIKKVSNTTRRGI